MSLTAPRTPPDLMVSPWVKIRLKNQVKDRVMTHWQPLYLYTTTSVQMPTWATYHGRLVPCLIT